MPTLKYQVTETRCGSFIQLVARKDNPPIMTAAFFENNQMNRRARLRRVLSEIADKEVGRSISRFQRARLALALAKDDLIDELDTDLVAEYHQQQLVSGNQVVGAVDWLTLRAFLQEVFPIILEWIKNRK